MENATKALLIAAAVLIAILIISLGIVIYNQASETVNSVNMSGQEIQAFNDQFLKYDGNGKRGTEVNALLNTVLNNNISELAENGATSQKIISVTKGSDTGSKLVDGSAGTINKVDAGKVYNIEVKRDTKSGLVNKIIIKDRT
mgnify:CR=1 FL=1